MTIRLKRLDRLDVATSDVDDAAAIYARNFGFDVRKLPDGAAIAIGDAEIRLKPLANVASATSGSEGMAAIWLEAEDVDQVIAEFAKAGIEAPPIRIEGGRRVLQIDPKLANEVPLFIFDRKV